MPAVTPQEVALAIVPKFTGGLSMLGSGYIAYEVISNPAKRAKTYHRLVAVMSLVDVLSSFCYFLSTWPMPPGENKSWKSPEHFLAAGNDATCTAQGFGIQLGVAIAFFNIVLSLHYLLVIKFHHNEASLRRMEPFMLGIPLAGGLGLSVPGLFLENYSNSNLWCWIANNWDLCALQGLSRDQCMARTANYRWNYYFYPLWGCVGLIVLAQFWLWWTVRQLEAKATEWRPNDVRLKRMKQSRKVAVQAAWYVTGFMITWVPYTALSLVNKVTKKFFNPHDPLGFFVLLMVVICQPIQGFLNLFIYHRASIVQNTAKVTKKLTTISRARSRAPSAFQQTLSALEQETLPQRASAKQDDENPAGSEKAEQSTFETWSSVSPDIESAAKPKETYPEGQIPRESFLDDDGDDDSQSTSSDGPTPVDPKEAPPTTSQQVRFDVVGDNKNSWAEIELEDEGSDWGMADLDDIYG
jgi:hypothetical protein